MIASKFNLQNLSCFKLQNKRSSTLITIFLYNNEILNISAENSLIKIEPVGTSKKFLDFFLYKKKCNRYECKLENKIVANILVYKLNNKIKFVSKPDYNWIVCKDETSSSLLPIDFSDILDTLVVNSEPLYKIENACIEQNRCASI